LKKVRIICVGKIKEPYLRDGLADYLKRLSRFCSVEITELADLPDAPTAVRDESAAVLSKMSGFCALLDIGGKPVSSAELADIIDKAYLAADTVTFVIGGSRGVDESVKARADVSVSFGRVTYPHRLMRLILCEQIYRAFSISAGSPYHK
jgi:23S rRNA (pseudouridine1915-N3)-methyltransferase